MAPGMTGKVAAALMSGQPPPPPPLLCLAHYDDHSTEQCATETTVAAAAAPANVTLQIGNGLRPLCATQSLLQLAPAGTAAVALLRPNTVRLLRAEQKRQEECIGRRCRLLENASSAHRYCYCH